MRYLYTDWIDVSHPDDAQKAFLESLKLSHLSFENFFAFYTDIASRIIALEAASMGMEFSVEMTPQKKQNIDKIRLLQEETMRLKRVIKQETQFNVKVNLSIEIKKLSEQMDKLKYEL